MLIMLTMQASVEAATPVHGVCVGCESGGTAGDPCDEPACAAHGWHYLPDRYARVAAGTGILPRWVGQRFAGYLVARWVEAGTYGEELLAFDPSGSPRPVSLTILGSPSPYRPRQEAAIAAQLEAELVHLRAIDHPAIAPIIDLGFDRGRPWIARERVSTGETLSRVLQTGKVTGTPFGPDDLLATIRRVLGALDAVHARGWVHEEVRPEQILLAREDSGALRVELLGLAMAKLAQAYGVPMARVLPASYLAPEQLVGKGIGPASDIFAIMAILFEACTGRPPYHGPNQLSTMARKLDLGYDLVAELDAAQVPEALRPLFLGGLVVDPTRRFPSVEVALDALDAAGDTIRAMWAD